MIERVWFDEARDLPSPEVLALVLGDLKADKEQRAQWQTERDLRARYALAQPRRRKPQHRKWR